LQAPDHVTDSLGCGSGFQILHGLFLAMIQPAAGAAVSALAPNEIKAIALMTTKPKCFIGLFSMKAYVLPSG
jgi:hypothetical protein